jgi:hypothetical protein
MGEKKATSMARSPLFLWIAFTLVHAWLGWQGFIAESVPYGDVSFVYSFWAHQAVGGGPIVGIDTEWVYPILAFIPMVIPTLGGLAPADLYPYGWIALVTVVNAGVFSFLIGAWTRGTVRTVAAWWWLAFLLCLGPISVARIDSIATPIAMVGLVFAISRPTVATTLLTVAAWIKVWPAAIVGTLWVAGRGRTRIVVAAAMTSAVVVSIALVLGAGINVLSFLTQQTGRGLQIGFPDSPSITTRHSSHSRFVAPVPTSSPNCQRSFWSRLPCSFWPLAWTPKNMAPFPCAFWGHWRSP